MSEAWDEAEPSSELDDELELGLDDDDDDDEWDDPDDDDE